LRATKRGRKIRGSKANAANGGSRVGRHDTPATLTVAIVFRRSVNGAGRLLEKLTGEKRTTPMELWLDWVFVYAKDFVDLIATPAEPSAPTAIYQSINRLAEASELAIDALPLVKRPRGAAQRSGRKGKYFKRREHKQWSDMYATGKWPTYTELADHLKKYESAVRKGIQKYRWTTLKAESSKRR
jgi:hypothetical protein